MFQIFPNTNFLHTYSTVQYLHISCIFIGAVERISKVMQTAAGSRGFQVHNVTKDGICGVQAITNELSRQCVKRNIPCLYISKQIS